jgi:short-subunit dehydrogenase
MRPYAFAGGCALVTGAASGIGAALATALAARGSNLVLLDRDADRLAGVADAVRAEHPGLAVTTYVVDLSDDAEFPRVAGGLPPITRRSPSWSTTPVWPSAAVSTK